MNALLPRVSAENQASKTPLSVGLDKYQRKCTLQILHTSSTMLGTTVIYKQRGVRAKKSLHTKRNMMLSSSESSLESAQLVTFGVHHSWDSSLNKSDVRRISLCDVHKVADNTH